MTVRDDRQVPFCWQSIPAMSRLRLHWPASTKASPKPRLVLGISVYQALTEIANEHRARTKSGSGSAGFPTTRGYIATKAGVDKRSVDSVLAELENLDLVIIERRRRAASVYVLQEPPALKGEDSSLGTRDRGGGEDSSPDSASKGEDSSHSSRSTDQEEQQEGSSSSPKSSEVNAVFEHHKQLSGSSRSAPRASEQQLLEDALAVASIDECKIAIDAAFASSWHVQHDRTNLFSIFRKSGESTRARVDFWLDQREVKKPAARPTRPTLEILDDEWRRANKLED